MQLDDFKAILSHRVLDPFHYTSNLWLPACAYELQLWSYAD